MPNEEFSSLNGYKVKDITARAAAAAAQTAADAAAAAAAAQTAAAAAAAVGQENTQDIQEEENQKNNEVDVIFPYRGRNTSNCTLIKTKNKNILIDLGTNIQELIQYLKLSNVSKINYIMITHYHQDHIAGANAEGLFSILNDSYFDCSDLKVYLPHKDIDWDQVTTYSTSEKAGIQNAESLIKTGLAQRNIEYIEPENATVLEIDDYTTMQFLNIGSSFYDDYYANTPEIYNNFSMIMILKHFNNKFLFMGDAQKEAQKLIYSYIDNVSVVTAPHHDIERDADNNFLRKLKPEYAVVMNYLDDDTEQEYLGFGLTTEFSGYLRTIGCKIFTTNKSRTIAFTSKLNNLEGYAERGLMGTESNLLTSGSGKEIPDGTDLDTFVEPGNYYTRNNDHTITLQNLPGNYETPGRIRIINIQLNPHGRYIMQILVAPDVTMFRNLKFYDGVWEHNNWTVLNGNGYGVTTNIVAANSDLNNIVAPGKHEIPNNDIMITLSNRPSDAGGGSILEVKRTRRYNDIIWQWIYCANGNVYYRLGSATGYISEEDPSVNTITWQDWNKLNTTTVAVVS